MLHAFMDDVSLMTTSTPASKIVLQRTVVALKRDRMKLKPQKSRSLVIKGGKYIDEQPIEVAGEIILSRRFEEEIKEVVRKIDKSLLTGLMKV